MSIEEKAKAYDKALKTAHKYHAAAKSINDPSAARYENIFPELRESEDERMCNKIIDYLLGRIDVMPSNINERNTLVAWLEKQKEQVNESDKIAAAYQIGRSDERKEQKELPLMDGNADLYFDEWNQQNQNPTKRQCFEEGMRYAERLQKDKCAACAKRTEGYIDGRIDAEKDFAERAGIIMAPLDKKEQKPVWSEEDEKMRYFVTEAVQYRYSDRELAKYLDPKIIKEKKQLKKRLFDWLRDLRPQPKQNCDECAKHLEGYINGRTDAENKLLEGYGILWMPDGELHIKPRWKPSEEQIHTLERAIIRINTVDDIPLLTELRDKLKALWKHQTK